MRARLRIATLGVALACGLSGCTGAPDAAPSRPPAAVTPAPEPAIESTVELPELETLPSRLITLTDGSAPAALAETPGAVWVQGHRAAVLTRLDAVTGEVTAVVDTGGHLGCGDLTAAFGSVWFTGCGISPGLVRIDAASASVVETLDSEGLGPVEFEGSLWVGHRIDGIPRARQHFAATPSSVGLTFPVPGMLDTEGGMASASGTLWTADKNGAIAYRLDPATQSVVTAVPMPVAPDSGYLISHDDAVWYTDPAHGALVRIDPETGETRLLDVRTVQPTEYWGIAASTAPGEPGRLWVRSGDDEVWLVDTRADAVLRRITVAEGAGGDVLQVGETLWVSSFLTDEVEMIALSG